MASMHIHEDTAKPENRTNLALLGILQIGEIREHLLSTFDLPADSLISPCPDLRVEEFSAGTLRPDFVVRGPADVIRAYVEAELGPEDAEQMARYRESCAAPVFSIVGRSSYHPGDLSLESLRALARRLQNSLPGTQNSVSLELFCKLVEHYVIRGNYRGATRRAALSEKMLSTTLVRLIYDSFGPDRIVGAGRPAMRGRLLLDTVKEGGLSVRLYSTETGRQGFSVMNRTSGRPYCEFPSRAKLVKYFPFRLAAADRYAGLVASEGADEVLQLDERRRACLPIEVVEAHFPAFARAIEDLM